MSSSSSNSIEVSSCGDSGSNKRKDINNSSDSVKKVCKNNSDKDNVVGIVQIDTVTYNDDQELTEMVILDNTNTFNDNDDKELTDMILDNPQTERVNDNDDRETSGSDPQNCMNTVLIVRNLRIELAAMFIYI
jgi:hypothetical protein